MSKNEFHKPALLNEAIEYLNVKPAKKYIDATIGGGGHAAAIVSNGGMLLGIDSDPNAVKFTKRLLAAKLKIKNAKCKIVRGNFKNIDQIATENGFKKVNGILLDLGMSSWQIKHSGRGFSFLKNEPLDMRMDPNLSVSAVDLVNGLTGKELYELFTKFGEEKFSRFIANIIVRTRRIKPIRTTQQLAELVMNVYSSSIRKHSGMFGSQKIHPATRVFQALRIVVNNELDNLKEALAKSLGLLEKGGRLVVISFHSLEDRIVKYEFIRMGSEFSRSSSARRIKILTKKPIRPSTDEIRKNPQARSAKLRAAEKV